MTSLLGWTLVNMDGSFFTFVYPLIQKSLGLGNWAISTIVTMMAVSACLATIVTGPLMDYIGRKKIFQWTIAFTAVGSVLSALSGGFWTLLVARCVTMAGNTSEWMCGQVMVTEGTPSKSRGWLTGFAQIGWPIGWFLTSFVVKGLVPAWGWRGVFWAGLIPILLILWARTFVKESERFSELKKVRKTVQHELDHHNQHVEVATHYKVNEEEATRFTYKQLFLPDLRRSTILFWAWQFIYNYGLFAVAYFLPTIAAAHGFTLTDSWSINAWGTGVGAIGYLAAAFLGNKFGRREVILIWLVLGGISGTFFAFGTHSPGQMAFWWAMYYFFTVGHMGAFVPFIMESFPTRARGTGASFVAFANFAGLLLAGLTSQWFVHAMGVEAATFLWLGITSWIAFFCACGTRRVKPGLELEEIVT